MKKLLLLLIFTLPVFAIGPRSWSDIGTATVTNSQKTVGGSSPFGPSAICVENTGSNTLYFDWFDGVAVAADGSTNLQVGAGKSLCFSNLPKSTSSSTVIIGFITASSTTTYVVNAIGAN